MPQRELERLQAVNRFMNLEIHKDAEIQEILELAAELCEMPVALVNLNDEEATSFKFDLGNILDRQKPKDTFWPDLPGNNALVLIPDTLLDPRLSDNTYVSEYPYIRFYGGAPLITHDGLHLGSICVMDIKPRQLSNAQQHLLKVLSTRVVQFIEFDFTLGLLKKQFLQAKDAEIKLRSFFESSVACHLLLGLSTEVLTYNRNMAELIDRMYSVELRQGMKADEILQGNPLNTFISEYNRALFGNTLRFEREVTYRTGDVIWWDVTFEPAFDPMGEIIGVSYNATDITERKLYEHRILSQNDSLKQIAYIQSHELRKPVASILGLINVIELEGYTLTPELIQMLHNAADELDGVIRSIIGFTE